MAKTKSPSPKKTAKAKASPEPPQLRRSPRKATQSAKALEADSLSFPAKVVKAVKKATSPAKKVPKQKSTGSSKKASPVRKASPAKKTTPAKRASPARKPEAEHTPATVPTPAKKRSPAQGASRVQKVSPAKKARGSTTKATKTATPRATRRATASPAAGASPTASPRPRGRLRKDSTPGSVVSQSPDRGWIGIRKPQTRSCPLADWRDRVPGSTPWTDSPKKKSSAKRGSASTQVSGESSTRDEEDDHEEHGEHVKVRRSSIGGIRKSVEVEGTMKASGAASRRQVRRLSSVGSMPSPKKSSVTTAARSTRLRTVSPIKPTTRKSPEPDSIGPARSRSAKSSQRSASRSRSASISAPTSPLKVQKTRSSRSPAKQPAQSSIPARNSSPGKTVSNNSTRGRPRGPAKSPTREKSVASTDRSRSTSRRPSEAAFLERFEQNDDQGKTLRRIESKAYKLRKEGKEFSGHVPAISKADQERAKSRGIERADLELGLRVIATNAEQRVRDGYDERVVHLPKPERPGSRGRQPSNAGTQRRQSSLGRPDTTSYNLEDGPTSASRQSSSRRSSAGSVVSKVDKAPQKQATVPKANASRRRVNSQDESAPLPPGHPSAPNRGTVHSSTNPQLIPGTNKRNPFFETMPGPEIWHRNMPPYFTMGETPFMEREVSRQISEDLARGHDETQKQQRKSSGLLSVIYDKAMSSMPSMPSFTKKSLEPPERAFKSQWELPNVPEAEVEDFARQLPSIMSSHKRKASASSDTGSPKRVRRRSWGEGEHMMRGAL